MAYTTIDDPEAYFQVKTYTGNGAADNAITLDGDTNMQPDMVWIKDRAENGWCCFDDVRGVTKRLDCAESAAETTDADTLDAFQSDGFRVDADAKVNADGEDYLSFCWKETATAGFDIVNFTGNGSARTISHSLSAVPHLMIVKGVDYDDNFMVYHHNNTSAPETEKQKLDERGATADDDTVWNDTVPTSSVFTVGTSNATNKDTGDIIAYLFSEKQGFSKFGTFGGNANADGAFINLGFRPAMIILKRCDTINKNWALWDNKRVKYNPNNYSIWPDLPDEEYAPATGYRVDFVSNGVKLRENHGDWNTGTMIYFAWAEAPFVNSEGVPGCAK